MLAGIALIVIGFGLLWSARGAGEVQQEVARFQARRARPGWRRRSLERQARVSPEVSVWVGRVVAAGAFVGGVILILRG